LFQGQTLQGRKLDEETTLVSCYLVVGKEENENMWEMLGLFRGFKQRRNWGENYFPVRFIACATGIIKFRVTN